MMSPMSAESTVVRNYVETLLSLPWRDYAPENRDIAHAESVLNADHYGLEKVKDRILEQLAVLQLNPDAKGSVICLVGPPGVGKTSLAKSVAEAQGRPFVRISLGGVRDEAEIRGHRRTYVGAMPGKIIQALRKTSKGNPVILLDEIDKMSSDYKGDPASAMLEVLDPEQNATFQDHYLEVEYDLSKVLFFATANYYENIPRPLLDRMEVIQLAGYTEEEKFQIAKTYLIPKQIKEAGLPKVTIKDDAVKKIISSYTKEAGVRRLERTFGTLARKLARKTVSSKNKIKSFTLNKKAVVDLLGPEKYRPTETSKENEIGTVNGMAWTEVGGDLLKIEATIMPGKGALQITGQLGDVMKESAQAAVSYVRSRSSLFDINEEFFQKNDIHIHVPEGATPKDGPSAGIALTTALVSAITKNEVRRNVAMTGEVTLRGNVLPIGGLKEKMLAAARVGIDTIIIPKDNEKDLKDIPEDVRNTLTIHCVKHVDEVLIRALNIKDPRELFKVTVSKQYGVKSQYE
jgi:ATP-dependent Lon protease